MNDFFSILDSRVDGDKATFSVWLNAAHGIYAAHFPGNPVTPGVCVIQIVKDLSERLWQRQLTLQKASSVKFMHVIIPSEHDTIDIDLSPSAELAMNATVYYGDTVFTKLSLIFANV